MPTTPPPYAELHCLSNFTFLRGASHPGELVQRARQIGYTALALTDECSLAGVVRAHVAAKEAGLPLIIGSELTLFDGPRFVCLATNRAGYGQLSALITRGRRRAKKGSYQLSAADLDEGLPDALHCFCRKKIPCGMWTTHASLPNDSKGGPGSQSNCSRMQETGNGSTGCRNSAKPRNCLWSPQAAYRCIVVDDGLYMTC